MIHTYHNGSKLQQLQYLKMLEKEIAARNANHQTKPGHTPGTEIITRLFHLEQRNVTQKIEPLPKCTLKMIAERRMGPFLEGGLFLPKAA